MAFYLDLLSQGLALLPFAIGAGVGLLAALAYLMAAD